MIDIDYKAKLDEAVLQSDVVKIFNNLLTVAVEAGASDIHIEPLENYCRIRIRIDGILQELVQYPKNLHESIISKFSYPLINLYFTHNLYLIFRIIPK